jgi:enoyl-[acyl-carrier-protein] reductase (NADH)
MEVTEMNQNLKNYLVSTAEDYLRAGVADANTIAWSVASTSERRGADISQADVAQILQVAISNVQEGKKVNYNPLTWHGSKTREVSLTLSRFCSQAEKSQWVFDAGSAS